MLHVLISSWKALSKASICSSPNRLLVFQQFDSVLCRSLPGEHRKGYMGHLTRLSITINTQQDRSLGAWLRAHVAEDELTEWQDFTNGPLAAVRLLLDTCLVATVLLFSILTNTNCGIE